MKIKEIKGKSIEELKKLLKEKRDSLKDIVFSVSGSRAKNVKSISSIKKDIARVLTLINGNKLSK